MGFRRITFGRWVLVVLGLGVLVTALVAAAGPYREVREFRHVSTCEQRVGGCFDDEQGSIVDRDTHTTTSTDSQGNTTTSTTFEVTWRRADGSRQTRDVPEGFYKKVRPGQPATLHVWRGEVVGVAVTGGTHWFTPHSGRTLGFWLIAAHTGFGMMLWGLLFGWWTGVFSSVFRAVGWVVLVAAPVGWATDALSYGPHTGGELALDIIECVFCLAIGGAFLFVTMADDF